MQQAPQRVILHAVRSQFRRICCNISFSGLLIVSCPQQHHAHVHKTLCPSQDQAILQSNLRHHAGISSSAAWTKCLDASSFPSILLQMRHSIRLDPAPERKSSCVHHKHQQPWAWGRGERHLPADEGLLHDADGALVEADARGLHAVQQVLPLRHGLRPEAVAILLVARQRRAPPRRPASRLHAHQSHDSFHTPQFCELLESFSRICHEALAC